MIKFNVLNRWSGKVQFTAEIDCDENENYSIKLGLAVKRAIENNADLRYTDLRYADLRYVDLSYTDLSYADLSYTNLSSTHLSYTNLRYTDLSYTDLSYTDLSYTDLSYANLSHTNLSYADLGYADLSYTDLSHAKNLVAPVIFGPVGKEFRTGHAVYDNSKVMVCLGCFYGTEKEAIAEINKKYGKGSSYAQMVRVACRVAKERGVLNPTQGGEDE